MARPKTDTVKKSITIQSTIWERIEELSGERPAAELCSELVTRGLNAYQTELASALALELGELEIETKKLVLQKLKQRQRSIQESLALLKGKFSDLDTDLQNAVLILEKGLTD